MRARDREYRVRIHFTEFVHGKPRQFAHDIVAVATGPGLACDRALAEFRQLEILSGVGWTREVQRVEVGFPSRTLSDRRKGTGRGVRKDLA